ncbi:MAG: sulfatase-like hydrolase/transferase [Saprospiraceae bacterium]
MRPNILLILADDMRYGDVSLAGNPYLQTPNLDQLAQSGVRFSHFYVSPVCAPTRASLLTGRYHQRTQVRSVTNGYETMDPEEVTLAEYLKPAGYRTGIFGKWHLGEYYPSLPNAQGFDEFLGFRTGHTADYYDPELEHNGEMVQNTGYITDVLTDAAIRFMSADTRAPFFCYLPYNAPHTPLQVDSSWWQPYSKLGLDERTARVYGMIAQIDENIGRLISHLEERHLLENTIIIFMSDNGPINGWRPKQEDMRYNAGLRDQKFTIYEGGIRTQAFWSWKDHWRSKEEESTIAAHIDVVPTILEITGIVPALKDKAIDGISLAGILRGDVPSQADRLYFEHYDLDKLADPGPFPGGIARKGPWKMVNGTDLYDLSTDVGESRNLSDSLPEKLAELKSLYLNWWQEIEADSDFSIAPIQVGHSAEAVHLQPHHARAQGSLQFMGYRGLLGEKTGTHPRGVDGDWLSHWQEAGDQATWQIKLEKGGNYHLDLYARQPQASQAIELLINIGDQTLPVTISPDWQSDEWTTIKGGTQPLKAGIYPLKVEMTQAALNSTFELRELIISPQ